MVVEAGVTEGQGDVAVVGPFVEVVVQGNASSASTAAAVMTITGAVSTTSPASIGSTAKTPRPRWRTRREVRWWRATPPADGGKPRGYRGPRRAGLVDVVNDPEPEDPQWPDRSVPDRPVPVVTGSSPASSAGPVARFLQVEAAGSIVLLAATVVALIWANSSASATYQDLWTTELSIGVGDLVLTEDLRHW